jgi:hypothetical protein
MPQHHAKRSSFILSSKSLTPTPDNSSTIALLQQWEKEDATDDPAAMAQAKQELAEFSAALNANRT